MKIESIKADCRRKMMNAMSATAKDLDPMFRDSVGTFYSGIPKVYVRTGELTNSPKVTGPTSTGDACIVEMELDPGLMHHTTGTFSEEQILDATNQGTSGVVGTPGYWNRAEENAKIIADAHFRQQFS